MARKDDATPQDQDATGYAESFLGAPDSWLTPAAELEVVCELETCWISLHRWMLAATAA